MANRYWVGGAGTWSSTTKWSATSGGASGATVPTTTDTAIFDANSGTGSFTATVSSNPSVLGIQILRGGITFSISGRITTGTITTSGTTANDRTNFSCAFSADLFITGSASISDCDFYQIDVRGAAAPITGTRLGDRGGNSGITFPAPKTVYWNLAGAQNWNAIGWASTSGGVPDVNNYPLPQDTAVFDDAGAAGTVSFDATVINNNICSVNLAARTLPMTINWNANNILLYGSWTNSTAVTYTGTTTNAPTLYGSSVMTIISAGATIFPGGFSVFASRGSVVLGDALQSPSSIALSAGVFDTAGYALTLSSYVTGPAFSSTCNVYLRNSIVTTTSWNFSPDDLSTVDAGTSTVIVNGASGSSISFAPYNFPTTFYNIVFSNLQPNQTTSIGQSSSTQAKASCNNLTFNYNSASNGVTTVNLGIITVTGAISVTGTSVTKRIFFKANISSTAHAQLTVTANSVSFPYCDFRNINLAGAAAGASPLNAGDGGNNTGITFPAPKTVYWNLAGAQNWSANGWASTSGGVPDVNNFPLMQDTAVFDDAGAAGTVSTDAVWNIGTINGAARSLSMTFGLIGGNINLYGDLILSSAITTDIYNAATFVKYGTSTINTNGCVINFGITVNYANSTSCIVQLASALTMGSAGLTITAGTFKSGIYSVTLASLSTAASYSTLNMGSGTWTITGAGLAWTPSGTVYAGSANLAFTSASAVSFGGTTSQYLNKITISTSVSFTFTITVGFIGELASTRSGGYSIIFTSGSTYNFGKWSIAGISGSLVTVGASATTAYTLAFYNKPSAAINYLSISRCTVSTTSPSEFYVGANSVNGVTNTRVTFTAIPAARTLYWVGGAGNWSSTTKWSLTSGGASGAAIPTSLDAVIFDSASGATAYTATIDAGVTIARCASLTVAGPATGSVTFAGATTPPPLAVHGNISLAATGVIYTHAGTLYLGGISGNSYTITTNGVTITSTPNTYGQGVTWGLGGALTASSSISIYFGVFTTNGYAVTATSFAKGVTNAATLLLNNSTVTLSAANPIYNNPNDISTVDCGTSTIVLNPSGATTSLVGQTYYNVVVNGSTGSKNLQITSLPLTVNTLTFNLAATSTLRCTLFVSPITINTLQVTGGSATSRLQFFGSSAYTLYITSASVGDDVDFQDITVAGAAAPLSGARFGNGGGNSGVTFPAPKTVYRVGAGLTQWSDNAWALTSGGAPSYDYFPLAQDTIIIEATAPSPGSSLSFTAAYLIGTINLSARTAASTLAFTQGGYEISLYGDWIGGAGVTPTWSGNFSLRGKTSQSITSAGVSFGLFNVYNTTAVSLQDALTTGSFTMGGTATFSDNGYNVSITNFNAGGIGTVVANGVWSITANGSVFSAPASFTSSTGTGRINLTGTGSKSFPNGSLALTGITLNNAGGGTLSVLLYVVLKDITATVPSQITLTSAILTLSQFTGTGTASGALTLFSTSSTVAGRIRLLSGKANVDYLTLSTIKLYPVTNTWYVGPNSLSASAGGLGAIFAAGGSFTYNATVLESGAGTDLFRGGLLSSRAISETASGSDLIRGGFQFVGALSEVATGADQTFGSLLFSRNIAESASGADAVATRLAALSRITETSTYSDATFSRAQFRAALADTASYLDLASARSSMAAQVINTATYSDTLTSQGTFFPQVSNSASGTDLAVANAVFPSTVLEQSTWLDSVLAKVQFLSSVVNTATVSDVDFARAVWATSVANSALVVDSAAVAPSVFNPVVLQPATALDTPSASHVMIAQSIDNMAISDLMSARFLWEPVDDSQAITWQNVPATQTPGWAEVDDEQTPGWTTIQQNP